MMRGEECFGHAMTEMICNVYVLYNVVNHTLLMSSTALLWCPAIAFNMRHQAYV